MTDVELLNTAISRSGLSARAFAEDVLVREYRQIKRWKRREHPIPSLVRRKLEALVQPGEKVRKARRRAAP
jgi:hypothetical protein